MLYLGAFMRRREDCEGIAHALCFIVVLSPFNSRGHSLSPSSPLYVV